MRAIALILVLLSACATPTLSAYDRDQANLRFRNQARELKVSAFVAPFFRDDSRRLLSNQPPDELELLVTPKGEPIHPGAVQEVLPAGTRVTVLDIDCPTRFSDVTRPLITPHDRPWVELAVEGRPTSPAYVFVLRPDVKSADEVAAEVDKLLTSDDLASQIAPLPEADQQTIRTKVPVVGASTKALEFALGTPHLRKVYGDNEHVDEDWTWSSDAGVKRAVHVVDGKVATVGFAPVK